MSSIDQARQRYLAKEEPQEVPRRASPKGVYVVWEESEIKYWSRTHDIATAGLDADGVLVKDARFKNGSKAGWTVYEMANGKAGGTASPVSSRGYLRWFYVKLATGAAHGDHSAEGMKRLVRTALDETHEVIMEKANADDNFSR